MSKSIILIRFGMPILSSTRPQKEQHKFAIFAWFVQRLDQNQIRWKQTHSKYARNIRGIYSNHNLLHILSMWKLELFTVKQVWHIFYRKMFNHNPIQCDDLKQSNRLSNSIKNFWFKNANYVFWTNIAQILATRLQEF